MTDIDLTAIRKQWLAQCGPCDAGLPTECSHPNADYRPVMAALCDEIEKLRAYTETTRHHQQKHAEAVREIEKLRAELARENRGHADTIDDRDQYQEMADQLAEAIAKLTGVDIGEHSSMNNPWENALQAATEAAEKAGVA